MNQSTYFITDAHIINRVPKSDENIYSCRKVSVVPIDVPVFVAFGGEKTNSDKDANHYAKILETLFDENDISGINIYSVVYNFGSSDSKLERMHLFQQAGRKIKGLDKEYLNEKNTAKLKLMKEKEPIPYYVVKLFNVLLLPRITDDAGRKISLIESKKRIRKIKFYAHCHGATTIFQLGNLMHEKMINLGYSLKEINEIEKNLLVIQHSPIAPLDRMNFNTLSFASADDTMMNQYDQFSEYIYENSADIIPSFFGAPYGNICMAGRLRVQEFQEHSDKGLLKADSTDDILTPEGQIIFAAERNALLNAAKHSIKGGPIPSINKIISGNGVNFKYLKANGDTIIKIMQKDLQIQNLVHDYQK